MLLKILKNYKDKHELERKLDELSKPFEENMRNLGTYTPKDISFAVTLTSLEENLTECEIYQYMLKKHPDYKEWLRKQKEERKTLHKIAEWADRRTREKYGIPPDVDIEIWFANKKFTDRVLENFIDRRIF